MQDKKDSMVFYRSFLDAIEKMPAESGFSLTKAIIRYGLDGDFPADLDNYSLPLFIAIQPTIDKAKARYKAQCENGRKGGAPKGNTNASKRNNPNQPNSTENNLYEDVEEDKEEYGDVEKDVCVYENGDSKGKIRTPEEILQIIYNTSEKDSFSYKL